MNYKELLFNKDKVLSFYPELAVILNKYDEILAEEEFNNGKTNKNGKKRRAGTLGLNEAIIINQISYWNEINKKSGNNFKDGYYWTYNTYEKWSKSDFPYWSADTIRKTITALEEIGVIISTDKYNSYKIDNTKWYRVDYDKLQEIINIVEEKETQVTQEEYESCDCVCESYIDGHSNVHKPIPENTTDITNRDYHSENTVISPTELNTDKSAIPLKGLNTSLSDERKAHGKSKDKWVVTKNHIVSVMDKLGYGELADETQSAIEIFRYYYARYRIHTGKPHPRLNDKTMTDTLRNYIMGSDEVSDHDVDTYEMLIDEHFKNNYGMDIDWSIRHFMTEDVRNKLYCRVR